MLGSLWIFIACYLWPGVLLREEKVKGSATTIGFLGIVQDMEKTEVWLPE